MRKTTRVTGRKTTRKSSSLSTTTGSSTTKSSNSKSTSSKSSGGKLTKSNSGGIELGTNKMGAQSLLPQAEEMLNNLFSTYGLQFQRVALQDPNYPEYVASVNKVAEVVKTNVKLLPKMLENTAILMKGQVDLAKYYAAQTALVTRGQKEIDKATVDSFLSLAGYNKSKQYLEHKVNQKLEVLDAALDSRVELCTGRAQSAMRTFQLKQQAGAKQITQNETTAANRQNLLAGAASKRRQMLEAGRYGHLNGGDNV